MILSKEQLERWHKVIVTATVELMPSEYFDPSNNAVWAALTHLNEETPYIGGELIRESWQDVDDLI